MSIRVVLADDHVVVRSGLRAMLEDEPGAEIVGLRTVPKTRPLAPRVASRLIDSMRASEQEALSAWEVEVLALVDRGLTNKRHQPHHAHQRGDRKDPPPPHLLQLGVDDRTQAVTVAARRGIRSLLP